MKVYVIRRPGVADSFEELDAGGSRPSARAGGNASDEIRWIRSYVVRESDGSAGTVSVYQAPSEETIREHAARAGIPATQIAEVTQTILVRPDPIAVVV